MEPRGTPDSPWLCRGHVTKALKSAPKPNEPMVRPMKRVVFSKRSRTYRVTKTYYPAKKRKEDDYPRSASIRPRKSPEKTKKEKEKAGRDAFDAAKGCKEDDRAIACLKLLGKWRRSGKHMTIYIQTSNEARREDETGNWRIPSDEETEIDSSDEMPGEVPPEWIS